MTALPELIETYDRDESYIYALWRITLPKTANFPEGLVFDIGCVIGVPACDRSTARAAMSVRPFLRAWYADSSDWSGQWERDVGLEQMQEHVVELWRVHHDSLAADIGGES